MRRLLGSRAGRVTDISDTGKRTSHGRISSALRRPPCRSEVTELSSRTAILRSYIHRACIYITVHVLRKFSQLDMSLISRSRSMRSMMWGTELSRQKAVKGCRERRVGDERRGA